MGASTKLPYTFCLLHPNRVRDESLKRPLKKAMRSTILPKKALRESSRIESIGSVASGGTRREKGSNVD